MNDQPLSPQDRFLVLYKAISFPLEIGSKLISTDEKKALGQESLSSSCTAAIQHERTSAAGKCWT
jgi:hypothetical protein